MNLFLNRDDWFSLACFFLCSFVHAGFVFTIFDVFLSLHVTLIGVVRSYVCSSPYARAWGHVDHFGLVFPPVWPLCVCLLIDCCVRGLLTAVDLTLFVAFYNCIFCLKNGWNCFFADFLLCVSFVILFSCWFRIQYIRCVSFAPRNRYRGHTRVLLHTPMRGVMLTMLAWSWPLCVCFLNVCCLCSWLTAVDMTPFVAFYNCIFFSSRLELFLCGL